MSSRGSMTKNGHVTTTEYSDSGKSVYDATVLVGNNGNHGLPDYSHSPNRIYIKENSDGSFREMRFYDENGKSFFEIGYHIEEHISGNRHETVLHYHFIDDNLNRSPAEKLGPNNHPDIYRKYKKYLEVYGL